MLGGGGTTTLRVGSRTLPWAGGDPSGGAGTASSAWSVWPAWADSTLDAVAVAVVAAVAVAVAVEVAVAVAVLVLPTTSATGGGGPLPSFAICSAICFAARFALLFRADSCPAPVISRTPVSCHNIRNILPSLCERTRLGSETPSSKRKCERKIRFRGSKGY